jgi:hypothetical protein
MKKFFKQNSLSVVLFALFVVFLVGLGITGYRYENQELAAHGQPAVGYLAYLASSGFAEAVFENWESEFLQMGALVVLTIWLVQKGSSDSKKLRGKDAVGTSSRYSIIHASTGRRRVAAIKSLVYGNSLALALFGLFVASFVLHAASGAAAANQDAQPHGQPQVSVLGYVRSSQFWFESFQNWQSEFLAVGSLIVLSVYLRQRGSPESKPVGDGNNKTGA